MCVNKKLLLDWLLQDMEENKEFFLADVRGRADSHEALAEDIHVLSKGQADLPKSLPSTPGRMIQYLRRHLKGNVTLISRVLSFHFPDKYVFYRVSKLEEEIFEAFDFFSSVVPEFGFFFPRVGVGKRSFDRYLKVNDALMRLFEREGYDSLNDLHAKVAWFLYRGLGELFLEKGGYRRYWVMATGEKFFESLDSGGVLRWSGRKEMRAGDMIFAYRTAPVSAITDVFEVKDEPFFDPWGEWDGFWVDIQRVCRIDNIPFSELREDPILGDWGAVRKRFVGTVTEPVSHAIYNRLLEKIPADIRKRHNLESEPTAEAASSGKFVSEEEFEDKVIEPLLKGWDFEYQRQFRCPIWFGSQEQYGRIDFHVNDGQGALTLFENKVRIVNGKELDSAVRQGKSYALMLGLPGFVVASPEGLWIYSLNRIEEKLEEKVPADELAAREKKVRSLLLNLRVS